MDGTDRRETLAAFRRQWRLHVTANDPSDLFWWAGCRPAALGNQYANEETGGPVS